MKVMILVTHVVRRESRCQSAGRLGRLGKTIIARVLAAGLTIVGFYLIAD
jgi:hypothetical protein